MIKTSISRAKRWYYDAIVGYIVCRGYTRREAKKMVRRYGLRKMLRKYTITLLRDPIEVIAHRIINYC